MVRRKQPLLLKKGKGLGRVPMAQLRQLENAGKKFQKMTKSSSQASGLKEIRKEIRQRKRK